MDDLTPGGWQHQGCYVALRCAEDGDLLCRAFVAFLILLVFSGAILLRMTGNGSVVMVTPSPAVGWTHL